MSGFSPPEHINIQNFAAHFPSHSNPATNSSAVNACLCQLRRPRANPSSRIDHLPMGPNPPLGWTPNQSFAEVSVHLTTFQPLLHSTVYKIGPVPPPWGAPTKVLPNLHQTVFKQSGSKAVITKRTAKAHAAECKIVGLHRPAGFQFFGAIVAGKVCGKTSAKTLVRGPIQRRWGGPHRFVIQNPPVYTTRVQLPLTTNRLTSQSFACP